MEPEWLEVVQLWTVVAAVGVVVGCRPLWRAIGRLLTYLRARFTRTVERASTRPIEAIAEDARRLGRRFRQPAPGLSFVKFEGTRRAYDKVLSEGCRALGIDHLLDVLPPGDELDAERNRVELRLWSAGLRLDDAA